MKETLVATKMELFAEEGHCPGMNENGSSIPEGKGLLNYLIKAIRPDSEECDREAEEYFGELLRTGRPRIFKRGYRVGGRFHGTVQFINCTQDTLDIMEYTKSIVLFFMKYSNEDMNMCFLCRDIVEGTPFPTDKDIVLLKLRFLSIYDSGRVEELEPKGRLVIANIDFPHSRY
ncbi:MAG: hypothetical protein ACI4S4_00405 [Candidatus Ornithospirochaeta sp.]